MLQLLFFITTTYGLLHFAYLPVSVLYAFSQKTQEYTSIPKTLPTFPNADSFNMVFGGNISLQYIPNPVPIHTMNDQLKKLINDDVWIYFSVNRKPALINETVTIAGVPIGGINEGYYVIYNHFHFDLIDGGNSLKEVLITPLSIKDTSKQLILGEEDATLIQYSYSVTTILDTNYEKKRTIYKQLFNTVVYNIIYLFGLSPAIPNSKMTQPTLLYTLLSLSFSSFGTLIIYLSLLKAFLLKLHSLFFCHLEICFHSYFVQHTPNIKKSTFIQFIIVLFVLLIHMVADMLTDDANMTISLIYHISTIVTLLLYTSLMTWFITFCIVESDCCLSDNTSNSINLDDYDTHFNYNYIYFIIMFVIGTIISICEYPTISILIVYPFSIISCSFMLIIWNNILIISIIVTITTIFHLQFPILNWRWSSFIIGFISSLVLILLVLYNSTNNMFSFKLNIINICLFIGLVNSCIGYVSSQLLLY
ncbi:Intimal thickness related receptor IRP domain-containing protein [Entamoeba marina]